MAYLLGLIVVLFFFLTLHYFTQLSGKQKVTVTLFLGVIIFGAISFNFYTKIQQNKMMHVVMKFHQDKSVYCNGEEVNSSNYTLSIGTFTFIGKKNTPNYTQMISASECE